MSKDEVEAERLRLASVITTDWRKNFLGRRVLWLDDPENAVNSFASP